MDPSIALAFVVFAVLLSGYYLSSRRHKRNIPGPKGYPIVGSALQIKPSHIHEQFYDFAVQYGPMFEIKMPGVKVLVLNTVDVISRAFHRDGAFFSNRINAFVVEYILGKECILFSNADKGHTYAKRCFTKGMRSYENGVHIFKGEIDRIMRQLDDLNGQKFEVVSFIQRSMINAISILLIGEEATEDDAENFSEYTAAGEVFVNPFTNALLSHLPLLIHIPYYKRAMERIVKAKQKLVDKYFYGVQNSRTRDSTRGLVDWFLDVQQDDSEAHSIFTDDMIKTSVLNDVFSGGVVTTAAVLPSIIMCLVNHPEYQTKLQEEIDTVIGHTREPTVNDKHECPFTEAVVMETMRYITPVPFLVPHVCSEDRDFEGFEVKAKTQVLANVWYVHHDASIWGDPWIFRPERFLDADGQLLPNSHPFMKSWIPFGIGRRQCPGTAMAKTRIFLYLTSLFQRWTFVPSPGKCGSCDPRGDNFVFDALLKPKPFPCIPVSRN